MGLIPAADLSHLSLLCRRLLRSDSEPAIGVTCRDPGSTTIDDVIAAEGPRNPAAAKAPHNFNMAFILVALADQLPSDESIAKVDRIRAAWEPYFAGAVDGHGAVSTALRLKPRR